jgi:hypothetical protein
VANESCTGRGEVFLGTKRSFSFALATDRQVEIQLLGQSKLLNILLIFEKFPVWLLSFDPSRIS